MGPRKCLHFGENVPFLKSETLYKYEEGHKAPPYKNPPTPRGVEANKIQKGIAVKA